MLSPSSEGSQRVPAASSSKTAAMCVQHFCLESPVETQSPGFLLAAGHIGIFCQTTSTKIPDSQKESR